MGCSVSQDAVRRDARRPVASSSRDGYYTSTPTGSAKVSFNSIEGAEATALHRHRKGRKRPAGRTPETPNRERTYAYRDSFDENCCLGGGDPLGGALSSGATEDCERIAAQFRTPTKHHGAGQSEELAGNASNVHGNRGLADGRGLDVYCDGRTHSGPDGLRRARDLDERCLGIAPSPAAIIDAVLDADLAAIQQVATMEDFGIDHIRRRALSQ
eukprot:INCI9996.1.p1 GENE.INCI9996.1~~INCI9996.1.p1  ORF type:complete len:214 (-),score=25.26 INCI9996.1:1168-1809(-)